MIKEHDSVYLLRDLLDLGLKCGDVGVVVDVHKGGEAYEVEFMTFEGETLGVRTLVASDVASMRSGLIPHIRQVAV
jgi:hypothetical protein